MDQRFLNARPVTISVTWGRALLTVNGCHRRIDITAVTVAAQNSSGMCRHPDLTSWPWGQNHFILGLADFNKWLKAVPVESPTDKVRTGILVVCARAVCRVLTNLQTKQNEKALRETQTLHAGCGKVSRAKNFRHAADPLPSGAGWPKFNQLEMVTTFSYKPIWWGSIHAISSYRQFRVIVVTDSPTHTHTHKQTDRTDYNTLQHSYHTV